MGFHIPFTELSKVTSVRKNDFKNDKCIHYFKSEKALPDFPNETIRLILYIKFFSSLSGIIYAPSLHY